MNLKSMRIRLPLTYAAIALLTALALSGVLILTLRDYYARREQLYLAGQATAIQAILNQMIEAGLPPKAIEAQVNSLAFLVQARLRFLDVAHKVLADSGDPTQGDVYSVLPLNTSVNVKGGAVRVLQSLTAPPGSSDVPFLSGNRIAALPVPHLDSSQEFSAPVSSTLRTNGPDTLYFFRSAQGENVGGVTTPLTNTVVMLSAVPRALAFGSYDLIAEGRDSSQRSHQVVSLAILDKAGGIAGLLELSEGPTFGGAILKSVVQASLAAGSLAVLLAAFVGWLVSRQVTSPLTALAQVTQDMAAGDLSVRADPRATGEFGELGASFNRMAERISATVGALRKFASDASHELKTPLTALMTDLELAQENDAASKGRDAYLQRAQEQVQRLAHLMDNLLDLSHLEAGTPEGQPAPVNLTALFREAGETFAAQAEQRDQGFDLDLPQEDLIVVGHADQLRRAVANLVDNAIKFNRPGGVVKLQLRLLDGQVEIRVSDSGIGIPPEDLDQLFMRFHRGRNSAAYNGSGLGLAIVQTTVKAHGGQVWAENNPSGGACFTIRLPRVDAAG
jgi:signal transduction histidine kinase